MTEIIEALRLSQNIDDSNPMELALSNGFTKLIQKFITLTILPKTHVKGLALLNDDIFFNEWIEGYENKLQNTKPIVKLYYKLIIEISKGIQSKESSNLISKMINKVRK